MGSHIQSLSYARFLATIYLVRDPHVAAALSFPGRSALRALGGKHSYSGDVVFAWVGDRGVLV